MNKYAEAKDDYAAVLKSLPNDIKSMVGHANSLVMLKDTKKGLAELNTTTTKHPKATLAHIALAVAEGNLGHMSSAIDSASRAIALDEKCAEAYCIRAVARAQLKQYPEALKDIEKCATLAPILADYPPEFVFGARGELLKEMGLYQAALEPLGIAHRLNPKAGHICFFLWETHRILGNIGASLYYADKLTLCYADKPAQERSVALSCRACSLVMLGRATDALDDIEKALKLSPKNPLSLTVAGMIENERGNCKEAKDYFERGAQAPDSGIFNRVLLAIFLSTSEDKAYRNGMDARRIAAAICDETNKKDPRALMVLAMAEAECGDFRAAVKYGEQALKMLEPSAERSKGIFQMHLNDFRNERPVRTKRLAVP